MSVLGTIMYNPFSCIFMDPRNLLNSRIHRSHSHTHPVLSLTKLPGLLCLAYVAYPTVSAKRLALPRVCTWFWNINQIPFPQIQLRLGLGSTNSRLINIAGKPLPFRRLGFSPNFAATSSRIFNSERSTSAYEDASIHTERLPTLCFSTSEVSVLSLLPSILGASTLDRSAITRCLTNGCF